MTDSRNSFFRQSGWLMIANVVGGMMMWAVHFLSKRLGPVEYGVFGTYLTLAMVIPALPLQMVMAHQAAQGMATNRQKELAGMVRLVWWVTLVVWIVACLIVFAYRRDLITRWGIQNPAGLYITLLVVLICTWTPLFWGVLQGQQNFLWLGWSMLLNAFCRVTIAAVAVLAFDADAAGVMVAVLIGYLAAVGMAIWQTRSVTFGPSAPFDAGALFREIFPLMAGFAAFQFLFTADTMFAKAYFNNKTMGYYVAAGTLARALMWLVGPLATVMFPRLVHSSAKSEKSNLAALVLAGTGILAVLGAISLSLLGPFVVRIVSGQTFVPVTSALLPWYAAAMVPLSLANVLLNDLLAKARFRIVPFTCILAVAYGYCLTRFHDSPVTVLKQLGLFNLVLLIFCAYFSWAASPDQRSTNSA